MGDFQNHPSSGHSKGEIVRKSRGRLKINVCIGPLKREAASFRRPPSGLYLPLRKRLISERWSMGRGGLYLLEPPNITIYIHPRHRTLLGAKNKVDYDSVIKKLHQCLITVRIRLNIQLFACSFANVASPKFGVIRLAVSSLACCPRSRIVRLA